MDDIIHHFEKLPFPEEMQTSHSQLLYLSVI